MSIEPGDLQRILDDAVAAVGVAGAQVSLLLGDEQLDVASGWSNQQRRAETSVDTVFQIGSTTKLFNAVLVHQLADDGRLDLDGPLTDVLPGLRIGGYKAAGVLTARDLISMRSGIDNGPYTDFGDGDDAVTRYVDALAEIPLVAEPGVHFGYSNASTVVAGRLVEQITGTSWERSLRTRVLDRAELRATAVTAHELPYHDVAVGHSPLGEPTKPWAHPRALAPAGSTLCASAGDLVRFARALRDEVLLSRAALQAMQTPHVTCPPILLADHWGAGAFLRTWGGELVVGHSGTNLSGSSTLLWFPGMRAAIATTTNVARLGYPLTARVLAEVLPDALGITPPALPTPDVSIAIDTASLCGRYRAHGVEHVVEADADELILTTSSVLDLITPIRVRLLPIGPRTFLPDDPAAAGNRGYALHFLGGDDDPASHLLHGVFLTKRAG